MAGRGLVQPAFLPTTRAEMEALGWEELDALLVSGDAYADHPFFGAALLGRFLVSLGLRTGLVAQPAWEDQRDVARLGRPRLFAAAGAGCVDSLLARYTAFRKMRSEDPCSPGGRAGLRPNRASIVYAGLLRRAFPGLPVLLGGIEASLRRAVHYDFWTDGLRRPIVLDAKADLVLFGMAERAVAEVARRLNAGEGLRGLAGTACAGGPQDVPAGARLEELPSLEEIQADPRLLMRATLLLEEQAHRGGPWLLQRAGGRGVILAPPAEPLATEELDALHALPFSRRPHPSYTEPIPALETTGASVVTHRGCGGGCTFCSLALHQGRGVRSRSAASVRAEVEGLTRLPGWRGSLADAGGPSANMWNARCAARPEACRRRSCLFPDLCPSFRHDQAGAARLLRSLADLPGVQHVRVASGVRHDLALADPSYLRALAAEFTGGQLKVAPEHISERVLRLMRKPGPAAFEAFLAAFTSASAEAGKEQYLIPYLISAFPGCTDADMRELANWLAARRWRPQQVQCFVPTPGTVATAMYFAGVDEEGRPIPVARTDAERLRQHRILMPDPAAAPARHGRKPRRPDAR